MARIYFDNRKRIIKTRPKNTATVQWQTANFRTPYHLSTLETVWLTYLEKIEGEAIFDDIGNYKIRKTVALEMRKK